MMTTPYEAAKEHFTANDLQFQEYDESKTLAVPYPGQNLMIRFLLDIDEEYDILTVTGTYPFRVPDIHWPAIAELVCRINAGYRIGAFQFDFADGSICCLASSSFTSGILPDEVIKTTFLAVTSLADNYYPAFMRVIYGGCTPEDALLEIQGPESEETRAGDDGVDSGQQASEKD